MIKYVKVMYGTTSGAKSDFKYKLNEINVANNWNPKATNGKDFGGFNYCSEECILRWCCIVGIQSMLLKFLLMQKILD